MVMTPRQRQIAMLGLGNAFNDQSRLATIQQQWGEHPGSAPNGTGTTGLNPADEQGWRRQQTDNTWAVNQMRSQEGKGPLGVQFNGYRDPMMSQDNILQNMVRMRVQGGGAQNTPFQVNQAQQGNPFQAATKGRR